MITSLLLEASLIFIAHKLNKNIFQLKEFLKLVDHKISANKQTKKNINIDVLSDKRLLCAVLIG